MRENLVMLALLILAAPAPALADDPPTASFPDPEPPPAEAAQERSPAELPPPEAPPWPEPRPSWTPPAFAPAAVPERDAPREEPLEAVRALRFELGLRGALTDSDGAQPGWVATARFHATEWLAFGGKLVRYAESEANLRDASLRRSARMREPLMLLRDAWQLEVVLTPVSAEFDWTIFTGLDLYALLAAGSIGVHDAAVVDPDNRVFEPERHLALSFGAGARFFVTRWAALGVELQDSLFSHAYENEEIARGNEEDRST
jgi:hypothetical protein